MMYEVHEDPIEAFKALVAATGAADGPGGSAYFRKKALKALQHRPNLSESEKLAQLVAAKTYLDKAIAAKKQELGE